MGRGFLGPEGTIEITKGGTPKGEFRLYKDYTRYEILMGGVSDIITESFIPGR